METSGASDGEWLVILATAIGGGVLVWLLDRFAVWWRRPRVRIVADSTLDNGCLSPNQTQDGGKAVYARLRVENKGRGAALGVRGYFVRVRVIDESGADTQFDGDTIKVRWAYGPHEPRDIPRGVGFYFDVYGAFTNQVPGKFVGDDMGNRVYAAMKQMRGAWITAVVVGENFAPQVMNSKLAWDGTITGLSIHRDKS